MFLRAWNRSVPRFYQSMFRWITELSCSDLKFPPPNDLKGFKQYLNPFINMSNSVFFKEYHLYTAHRVKKITFLKMKKMKMKYSNSIKRLNQIENHRFYPMQLLIN